MVMKRDKPRVPPSYQSFAALFACLLAVVERCGLLPEVAAAALLTFLAVVALTLQHTNEVRCSVLGDQTPAWRSASVCNGFSTLNVVSMLRLQSAAPRGSAERERALAEAIDRMRHTAGELGGQVNYVGRAVEVVVQSAQLPDAKEFDVVVLTSWAEGGRARWAGFRRLVDSDHGWERHVASGFWRNPLLQVGVVLALLLLRLKCGLRGVHHNIAEAAADKDEDDGGDDDGDDDKLLRTKMDALAATIEKLETPKAGVLICNCLTSEVHSNDDGGSDATREEQERLQKEAKKAQDGAYSMLMMEMLAQHGGGPLHVGRAAALSSAETGAYHDGDWELCACVYYPGCVFFKQLMRSAWMQRTVKLKSPGDSIAVLTVPFRSTAATATTTITDTAIDTDTGTSGAAASASASGFFIPENGLKARRKLAGATEATEGEDTAEGGVRRRRRRQHEEKEEEEGEGSGGGEEGKLQDAEPKLVVVPFLAMVQLVVVFWLLGKYYG
eukprot:COSAG06_NODE_4127_length_4542_cov_2.694801_2_plen_499_part_00